MTILDTIFPDRRRDPHQVLANEVVRQTSDIMHSLVALREEKGITQQDVADRMGISRSAVAQLERYDANPTLSSIRRYALAVEALIEVHVSDGLPWAKTQLQRAAMVRRRRQHDDLDTVIAASSESYIRRAVELESTR